MAAEGITSPALRAQAVRGCARQVALTHRSIDALVLREGSGYEWSTAMQQMSREVEALLDVFSESGGLSESGGRDAV